MAAGAQGIKAGRVFVEVGTHDKYIAGLRSAQRRLKAFGSAVGAVGSQMMRMGALALAPLLASAKVFASMGDRIGKMARRTGMSVEALSGLEFAASQSGTSIEALEKGIKAMQRTIFDAGRGLSTAVDGLDALGLSYRELAGLAPEEQFKLIADRLSRVAHASDKAAVGSMVFGRAGTAMLPMIADGAKGIDDLIKKAEKYGLVITTEAAQGAEEFTDAMDIAGRVVKMAAFHVGAALVPSLMDATKWIVETTTAATDWIKKNKQTVVWILKWAVGIVALGATLWVFGKMIALVGALIGIVKGLYVALTFLAAHPVVAVLAAIAVLAVHASNAFGLLSGSTADLSDEMEQLRKEGDKTRAADKLRMKRLRQLAEQESRTAAEMAEAADLTKTLTDRYGDMGASIDRATGKIGGMEIAQKKLNEAMRAAAILEVSADLEEQLNNQAALFDQLADTAGWTEAGRKAAVEGIKGQIEVSSKRARALGLRLRALKVGDESAITGDVKTDLAERIAAGEAEAGKVAALDRRILQLKLQQIDDEHARAIKSIDERYDHERNEAGKNAALIARLNEAAAIEKQNLDIAFNRRAMGELQRALDQAAETDRRRKEAAGAADLTRGRDIEELELRATKKGRELEMAMLQLRRRRAIEAARAAGANVELVRKEWDLRQKILEGTRAGAEAAAAVTGTFSARALWGIGGGKAADRTAKATEETAKGVKRILSIQQAGGLVFTR